MYTWLPMMSGLESRLDSRGSQSGGGGLCYRHVHGYGVTVCFWVGMGVQAVVVAQPVLLQDGGQEWN